MPAVTMAYWELLALQLGANHVLGIDVEDSRDKIARACELNAVDSGKFDFAQSDVKELSRINEAQKQSILIGNMGPSYGNTHLDLIESIKMLPNVKVVFLGGYFKHDSGLEDIKAQSLIEAMQNLQSQGFRMVNEFSLGFRSDVETNAYIAFVMER